MKLCSCILLIAFLLSACTAPGASPNVTPSLAPTATHFLPTPVIDRTRPPDAQSAARTFLDDWKAEDYEAMYALLTPVSQDAISLEDFTQRYRDVAVNTTLQTVDYDILSALTNPANAQVAYRVTFHTKMVGDLVRDNMSMNLSLEKGSWRVQWDDGLIMPELHGGNTLRIEYDAPTRGNLYDLHGEGVAMYNEIFALGILVGENDPEQEGTLLSVLSDLTGRNPESIKASYENAAPGTYVAVGEVERDRLMERYDTLSGLAGLRYTPYTGRYYADGGIAPHVTGYVSAIQAGEQDEYLRNGYQLSDRVGRMGLENWGESYLTGQKGATLDVYDPQGRPVTQLVKVERKPSQSIYMTIDSRLQYQAQQAIAGFSGAIVVMERDTGRVLAMVSSPGFDPNAFEYTNENSYPLVGIIQGDGQNRLFNRATGNGYPLGSVFKIITMAAALESGLFTPEDTYNCTYEFTDLPGQTLYDWTYDKGYKESGILTLPEGLMRSCNPWFYHIGLTLYQQGHTTDVSKMARAFGLGSPTGLEGVDESSGNMPDPTSEDMAVREAIGQSEVLVNPLQVARFVAAVGNGGTLYKPQVVDKIVDPDGNASFTFQPEVQGTLPVKPENLEIIQAAMRAVIKDPRGTAVRAFGGMGVPIYGKTGTAQNDWGGHPHAWFAGYTDAGREDKPDIAVAVIAEYAGEGSDIAAPIFRRVIEAYFLGQPQTVYPWESRFNITRTPTPLEGETPVPDQGGSGPADNGSGGGDNSSPSDGSDFNLRTATPSP